MPKPGDLFVGVLDFFAILLPGAVATAVLSPGIESLVPAERLMQEGEGAERWAVFLLFAYFLGHLIFLVGSYIDVFYNFLRERFNPYGNESAYQCASRIRDGLIDHRERKALNTFQWARAVLIAKNPDAAADVHRLEADSKFFRSLLVVCFVSFIAFSIQSRFSEAFIALVLMIPCFARYYERRLKSTTQAYIHVVTMSRLGMLKR